MEKRIELKNLNLAIWKSVTSKKVATKETDKKCEKILEILQDQGYTIRLGSIDTPFSFGEMRILSQLSAWIADIKYSESLIHQIYQLEGKDADTWPYPTIISDAYKGLADIRKIHPNGIDFFIYQDGLFILKHAPYFMISEILLIKTGFVMEDSSLSDFSIE